MAIIQCPECGNKVSTRAESCPHCGHPVHPTATPSPDNSHKAIIIGAISIAAIAIVAVALIFLNRPKSPQTPGADTEEVAIFEEEEQNIDPGVKLLTQYPLVEIVSYGVTFRHTLESQLKNLGFTVQSYSRPDYLDDEMDTYTVLTASRQGNSGVTTIKYEKGEDQLMTIDFANKAELKGFVESMTVSHYTQDGTLYSHPSNDMAKIYVRIDGLQAKIISPFEMLPTNF